MHDEELAAVGVELDFAEEGDAGAGGEAVGEPRAVEPFGEEGGAGGIGEFGFEETEGAAAESGGFGGADFGDNGGEFTGGEFGDGLEVGAVFVAEGEVIEEVFEGLESFGCEDGGTGGTDAFEVRERGVEGQGGSCFQRVDGRSLVFALLRSEKKRRWCRARRGPKRDGWLRATEVDGRVNIVEFSGEEGLTGVGAVAGLIA